MSSLKRISDPSVEPVSTAEAKLHLHVDHDTEDALIASLVKAARETVERHVRRSLVEQQWRLTLPRFPSDDHLVEWRRGDEILLPYPPVQQVDTVVYIDADGVPQTLDAAKYTVLTDEEPGVVVPAFDESWPSTRWQLDAVTVTYTAGYPDDAASPPNKAANVPQALKQAILLLVGDMYANREAAHVGTIRTENTAVRALLTPYEVVL